MIYYESAYLAHHGIKGQSWGHRNGPPYPLDVSAHSSAERKAGWRSSLAGKNPVKKVNRQVEKNKKRFAKDIAKDVSENKHLNDNDKKAIANTKKKIVDNANFEINKAIDDVRKASDQWDEATLNDQRYDESEVYKEYYKKAYDDCYKWFEENDPDYLKELISYNNGSKEGLDKFHGFDTVMDSYSDYWWSKGEKIFNQQLKDKGLMSEDQAYENYSNKLDKCVNLIVGKYGEMPIDSSEENNSSVRDIVRSAIVDIKFDREN